jgi:hypothetical protein
MGLSIAALALALCAAAVAEAHGPVLVSSRVSVDKASLTLADLLPLSAPKSLRSRAALVSLGAAPLPGALRQMSRAEIEARVGRGMSGELEIPSDILVERTARELSRQEVFGAIRAALAKNGFPGIDHLQPRDIRFQMPVMVTQEHPSVRVLGMKLDRALRQAIFRLGMSNETAVRPFDVMVRPVGGLNAWLESGKVKEDATIAAPRVIPARAAAGAGTVWHAPKPKKKPLVLPWQTASLFLTSGTMEIHTTAQPLERGFLGQVIRVRVIKSKQIFQAKVVGRDCLEARF